MLRVKRDEHLPVNIWSKYKMICDEKEGKQVTFEYLERMAFYERAKASYAVIHTG